MAVHADLSDFLTGARGYLSALEAENTRDWFHTHKSRYDAVIKRPGQALLETLEPVLADWTGAPVRSKLFRPHRDMRFSDDKTPYHTHLHLLWSCADGRGWFFGLAPDYATAGAGVMAFDGDQADRFRAAVDDVVEGPALDVAVAGMRVDPPALTRVPAPYPADHARAGLLRHKGLVGWRDGIEAELTTDPKAALLAAFDSLRPLQDWLARVV